MCVDQTRPKGLKVGVTVRAVPLTAKVVKTVFESGIPVGDMFGYEPDLAGPSRLPKDRTLKAKVKSLKIVLRHYTGYVMENSEVHKPPSGPKDLPTLRTSVV